MTNGLNMLTDKIYCHSNNFHAAPFHGSTAPRGGIDQIRYTSGRFASYFFSRRNEAFGKCIRRGINR